MADEAPNSSEWQWEYKDMESSQENTGMLMYDETKNTHPTSSAALSNPAASLEKKKKKDLGTITSSPSFQELDRAIGATLALSLNENEANSNMKSYSRSTFNQKVDRGSPRTKKNVQARNPSRVSTSPDANSVGIASSRADLKPFCAETESRAIILYHSPMTNPAQIRVACQKFGVLHYMRPEFHSTGITLLCYFDLRVAVTAQAELATELAHDKEVSAHFSIMLQAANKIDESRLILRNFPAGRTESDVEEIFKNYGQLKSIQRIFSGKTQGNGTKANFEFVVEFFNIQDARLAASELYSSSSKLWDSKTEISLATIDKREQSLCLQLLTILSRWRGWLPSPSQQMMPMPVSMPGTSMSRPMYQYPQYSSVMMGDSQGQSSHVMLPSYEQMAYNNQNFYGAAGHGSYEFPQHLMPMYSNVRVLPQDMMQAPYETAQERQQVEWMNSIPPTNAYEPYHSGPGPPMFREKFMRRSGPYNIARAHHSDRPFYHDGGYGQPKNSEARVDEQSDFTLNIAKLRSGEEQRTTLMVRKQFEFYFIFLISPFYPFQTSV